MMLLMKLESIEHARFRALSQIVVDKDKGVEAFEEYMKIAFPYLEATQSRERNEYIDLLQKEATRGPMVVTPLEMPKMQSRLKKRVVRAQQRDKASQTLYEKLGDTVPVHG